MGISLVTTGYGPPAGEALRRVVGAHKADDALAPVSVIVPANSVGVAARRGLARPNGPGHVPEPTGGAPVAAAPAPRSGIAGVHFLTLYRLAELLGAPALAGRGRRPVSTPVLGAAVRRVLATAPGRFSEVAGHPATEEALVSAHHTLSDLSDEALAALAASGDRAGDVVRVHRAVRDLLRESWFEERDLMDSAAQAVDAGTPVLADVGALVLHLPQRVSRPAAALLCSAAARAEVTVIAALTGVAQADRPVLRSLELLGLSADPRPGEGTPTPTPTPHGTAIVSCSDADDEVRAVVRRVIGALRDGTPLERMAILYGTADPYARLVHEQLDAARIPHNGTAVRTLAHSALGRSLLTLLGLPDRDFRRPDVLGWLASAPVRLADGRFAPTARWERISRRAGVVAGPRQWHQRLDNYIADQRSELAREAAVPDREPHPARYESEVEAAEQLRAFVTRLVRDLQGPVTPPSGVPPGWAAWCDWAGRLIRAYLGGERARSHWPEEEQQAARKIEEALDRLAGLDAVEPTPTAEVFRRTLSLELDADLGRVGRLGEGVFVGTVGLGLGLDLERVFVLGLAEGLFPPQRSESSLLPDEQRRQTAGELPLVAERVHDDHRALLAALASTRRDRVLTWPRGDLRRSTEHLPSRFLLDTVAALHGERLYADGLAVLRAPWLADVPSFASGIAECGFPATPQEHRLRTLLDRSDAQAVRLGRADPALERAVTCVRARRSDRFTRFDGNLTSVAADIPSLARDDAVVSATRLETWAASPFDFFMEYVLRVEIPVVPEEAYELSPLDKGSLVHAVLEGFLREVIATGPPDPATPWSAEQRARLAIIAAQVCGEYEARGVTGRSVFWQRDRRRLLTDLERFLDVDDARRARYGLTPLAAELGFGRPRAMSHGGSGDGVGGDTTQGPISIPLSDGRALRFRGAADRVDRAADGSLFVVDYKTGRADGYRNLGVEDPDDRGTRLQLPVYAYAGRAAYGDEPTPVHASYWFVTSRGGFEEVAVPLTAQVAERLDRVLRTIADGVGAGVFPCPAGAGRASRRERSYSDPDALGLRDRAREWERKKASDPALLGYLALAEPDLFAGPLGGLVGDPEGVEDGR